MTFLSSTEVKLKAKSIQVLLLDVDGVLSDGKIYFDENGKESKAFNTLDGHGIKMLQRSGVKVGIITGRNSYIVEKRAQDLGIEWLKQGREDKFDALSELLQDTNIELENIAYMGDDYPDLSVMCRVGLALCPANAHTEVAARSHWQSSTKGGEGAVREACDLIMQAQNTYQAALEPYINSNTP